MISALGGASHAPIPLADPDLAKAQRQLADWQACPSRKTPEGQAKIKQYSEKVNELTARDKKAQAEKPEQAVAANRNPSASALAAQAAGQLGAPGTGSSTVSGTADAQNPRPRKAGMAIGGIVDVYA